jgi:hypothetical protein
MASINISLVRIVLLKSVDWEHGTILGLNLSNISRTQLGYDTVFAMYVQRRQSIKV